MRYTLLLLLFTACDEPVTPIAEPVDAESDAATEPDACERGWVIIDGECRCTLTHLGACWKLEVDQ